MDKLPPSIEPGERALIAGRTGTGKSTLACWLLNRSPQNWIIFNPKHTAAYRGLSDAVIYKRFEPKPLIRDIQRKKYTIINFRREEADPEFMDAVLTWLHEKLTNVGVCIDELYTMHGSSGRAGDGLVGWLTRGRELRQSFLGLTQRPAFISMFLFSEANYIGAMDLTRRKDRARMVEETGREEFLHPLVGHQWLWYNVPRDDITLYPPVPKRV